MWALLSEDENILQETVSSFFKEQAPVSDLRALRDAQDETGFRPELWRSMSEMGLGGVVVEEQYGGSQMGYVAAGQIAEAIGSNLSATPFFSTSVLAASVLAYGLPKQKQDYLPRLVSGERIIAFASEEGAKHNPKKIETLALPSGNGYKLNGNKTMVFDGHVADQFIVTAMTPQGLALFILPADTKGVTCKQMRMVDSRNAAKVIFEDVEVTGEQVIGSVASGAEIFQHVRSVARGILAAEMLGAASQVFELTAEYLRERKQFGRIIGSFQALQHRAAHLYCELENARSAVLAALRALDKKDSDADQYTAMAKAKLGTVSKRAALEAVQMHGGMGMTDELDIGLYLKRIRVLQEAFGDGDYYADQLARTKEY